MADLLILWDKATDAGAWSGGNWRPTLPLANLATDDVQEVARSASAAPADTWFRVVLPQPSHLSAFFLLNHTLSNQGRVRFAVSDAEDPGGPFLLDSGWRPALEPTELWGAHPWGSFSFDGIDRAAYPSGPLSFWRAPGPGVIGRVAWVWIDDPGNPAGVVDAGRFIAGPGFSPPCNMDFGVSIDPAAGDGSTRRTRGGRKVMSATPTHREIELTLEQEGEGAGLAAAFAINVLGRNHTMMIVYDPDDDPYLRFRRTLYCSLVRSGKIVTTGPQLYSWTMHAEEET